MDSVRWNIAVSSDMDQSVRMFLASQGGSRKGDLSRFIEEAVRAYLFERAVQQAKAATADRGEAELNGLIDEAVQWAREPLPEDQDHFARTSHRHDDQQHSARYRAEHAASVTGQH